MTAAFATLVLWPPTAWHWLALGLLLIAIEMMTGTFDLLWVAIAAGLTSLFTALAPAGIAGWQIQLVLFALISTLLVIAGKTAFKKIRLNASSHPRLNKRMDRTIGKTVVATGDFSNGLGRVKLGDTVWSAETVDGETLDAGKAAIVEDTTGNTLKVRPL